MSAYNRDGLSLDAYLVRIIAALCKANGGELRVRGELVDAVGESTVLLKAWDSAKQELVLTVTMGTFGEVFKVVPERQSTPTPVRSVDPLDRALFHTEPEGNGKTFTPKTSTIDNPNLSKLERDQRLRRAAAIVRDEQRLRQQERNE